ncbi:MAG: hypothetical protein AB7E79_06505 [Rhodospirillaceae bacterium]
MPNAQLNVTEAKVNPSKFFKHPQEVLTHPELSRQQKLEILHQWEIDARLMAVAEEENMTSGENGHLGAIVSALLALDDETKGPHAEESPAPPTKLGSVH